MIKRLSDLFTLSKKFNIKAEDILFIDINSCGINVDIEADRVRFFVKLLFKEETEYFCALQVREDSKYIVKDNILYFENECIGRLRSFEIDFCDSYYMRRRGTVLNINPKSRVNCEGCRFCYTSHQKYRNIIDLTNTENLEKFFVEWMDAFHTEDLSNIYQIAVVSGCFFNEKELIEFLLELNKKVKKLKFKGEIFYMGSQLETIEELEKLQQINKFAYCITLECFQERQKFLKNSKSKLSLEEIKRIMQKSMELGFRTNYTYIVGLESIDTMETGFREFLGYINSFPIINVLQEHQYQLGLKNQETSNIEYYLNARKKMEEVFKNSKMRPQTWEVCRTLWYTSFDNEKLLYE